MSGTFRVLLNPARQEFSSFSDKEGEAQRGEVDCSRSCRL